MFTNWNAVCSCYIHRVGAWRRPPNWSADAWRHELHAVGYAAAWQATCDYNPQYGVPLAAFVYRRMLDGALNHFRQEWRYAGHCTSTPERVDPVRGEASIATFERAPLYGALELLGKHDRWLMWQLFWEEHTEADLAATLGVSQQAISKRKRKILQRLRGSLETAGSNRLPA